MPRVLYIEDDNANIELIRRYLAAIDCELIVANTGGEGLASAVDNEPDVILMDIYLPDINGLEVTDQIKSMPALANIPVVALTTDDSKELRDECMNHGFADVLHKPVRPQNLLDIVQELTA